MSFFWLWQRMGATMATFEALKFPSSGSVQICPDFLKCCVAIQQDSHSEFIAPDFAQN